MRSSVREKRRHLSVSRQNIGQFFLFHEAHGLSVACVKFVFSPKTRKRVPAPPPPLPNSNSRRQNFVGVWASVLKAALRVRRPPHPSVFSGSLLSAAKSRKRSCKRGLSLRTRLPSGLLLHNPHRERQTSFAPNLHQRRKAETHFERPFSARPRPPHNISFRIARSCRSLVNSLSVAT